MSLNSDISKDGKGHSGFWTEYYSKFLAVCHEKVRRALESIKSSQMHMMV